jgi:hypothetical protein
MDYNIEERCNLIISEKRWDNQLTRGTKANDVRCGGGEMINADDAMAGRRRPATAMATGGGNRWPKH